MHRSVLKTEVRTAEHKEQMIFDDIHVLGEHDFWTDEKIVEYLSKEFGETEARLWLRRCKEVQMAKAEKDYQARIAQLSGEIAEINKMLAMMENRK